jgi:hypothetical protein
MSNKDKLAAAPGDVRVPDAAREAAQIIDELLQCANVGRYDGKLCSDAKDWLAQHYARAAAPQLGDSGRGG